MYAELRAHAHARVTDLGVGPKVQFALGGAHTDETRKLILARANYCNPSRSRILCAPSADRTTAIGKTINNYLQNTLELDDKEVHLMFSRNRWELL